MKAADPIDTARLSLALTDLRLPAIKLVWPDFAARSDKEGWPAARFLAALAEHEMAERARRRIERHLDEARLPPGKTFDSFDFDACRWSAKRRSWHCRWRQLAGKGANLLLFGPPGGGKSHLGAALGLALLENGWRVLFTRTSDLVQRLQTRPPRPPARGSASPGSITIDLLILDDLAYVSKDQAETQRSVRADRGPLRTPLAADHGQPALWRLGARFSRIQP